MTVGIRQDLPEFHEGGLLEISRLKDSLIAHKPCDIVVSGRCPLLESSLTPIMDALKNASGLGDYRVTACDAMSIWLLRASQVCSTPELRSVLSTRLNDEEATYLFHYVVDFWNDSGAPLGNSLRGVFAKLIVFMKKAHGNKEELFESWLLKVLKMSNTMKILYFMVENLSKETRPSFVLEISGDFVDSALAAMWSNALANPAGKAIQTVFKNIYNHFKRGEESPDEKWLQLWKKSVARALKDSQLRKNVETYLLPYLFRTSPIAYRGFVKSLMVDECAATQEDFLLVLGCLKIGQDLAILVEPFVPAENEPAVISLSTLESLLGAQDPQLKLSALSLLVSSPKGSKSIVPEVLVIVENHWEMLFVETDLEARNELFSLMRQFLIRIKDSAYSLKRDASKLLAKFPNNQEGFQKLELVKIYEQFIENLLLFISRQLLPSSSHQKINMGLKVLTVLIRSGLDPNVNKNSVDVQQINWPFSMPIFSDYMVRLLLDNILNDYDDIRQSAVQTLLMADLPYLREVSSKTTMKEAEQKGLQLLTDMKGRTGDSGALIVDLLFEIEYRADDLDSCLRRLEAVRDLLISGILLAKENMVEAVYQKNVHGYFSALRLVFAKLDYTRFSEFGSQRFQHLTDSLINSLFEIWTIVKPILSDDSPEGNLPAEFLPLLGSEAENKYGPPTQILSSYSWRAVKESSAFLKELMDKAPSYVLSEDMVVKLGYMIMEQLASVKHRGAFSSVYPTLISCCERCNRSNSDLSQQPGLWLRKNTSLIEMKSQSITRRSGGIPFLITAILTADQILPKSTSLDVTMTELLRISRVPYVDHGNERMDIPQVHGMNCIKAIFTESQLADASAQFVDEALDLVLSKFGSPTWSIRNCAVMLFTALQNRLFGTKNVAEGLSSISARLFFSRFKNVKQVLHDNLASSISKGLEKTENIETVFPILTIISRLEATPGYHGLDDFKPLLQQCLQNRDWKVRENAARALPALVSQDDLTSECEFLLKTDSSKQNKLHGSLLALKELLRTHFNRNGDQKSVNNIKQNVESRILFYFGKSGSASNVSMKCLLDTYVLLLSKSEHTKTADPAIIQCLGNWFVNEVLTGANGIDGTRASLMMEVISLLLRFYIHLSRHEEIIECVDLCLASPLFEVQTRTIEIVSEKVAEFTPAERSSIMKRTWALITDHETWIYVKSAALRLLNLLLLHSDLNVIDDILQNGTAVLLELLSEDHSEEVRSSSIEALGPLIACGLVENKLVGYDAWASNLKNYSRDGASLDLRASTLKSVVSFLQIVGSHEKLKSSYDLAKSASVLYSFLSDDDEDLRHAAATELSRLMGLSFPTEPTIVADYFRNIYLSQQFEKRDVAKLLALNSYCFYQVDPSTLPELVLLEDDNLFTVEKDNFYRDNLSDVKNYKKLLLHFKQEFSSEELTTIATCTSVGALGGAIRQSKFAQPEWGFVNDETVFTAAACIIFFQKLQFEVFGEQSDSENLIDFLSAYAQSLE
ncbi:unnamed protein product [Kuraishia capsulata CBS 1993]|uniref:Uncharacterized protein n=1 Tax=Kuraishia capsulata CBS 1993 TaxID=1382522 RepID=W6MUN5_9ASCO|nr:uncharacterized protein KUCA_T00001755001 [Kuraishia capsulata CBS 1993]CDK25785.1 unnamed protein product [Kuraishia capsulata CBS 1993]